MLTIRELREQAESIVLDMIVVPLKDLDKVLGVDLSLDFGNVESVTLGEIRLKAIQKRVRELEKAEAAATKKANIAKYAAKVAAGEKIFE